MVGSLGQFGRGAQAAEELVVGDVDAVAKRLVLEDDLQRDDCDPIPRAPLFGKVGGGVGDHREPTRASHQVWLFDGEDERVVLLAALLDFDREAGEIRTDGLFEVGKLVIARALAPIDGDQLVRVGA